MTFSRDGKRIYSSHDDGAIRVWDVSERRLVATWKEHKGPIRRFDLSRDGRYLASASDDGTALVWDTTTGQVISRHPGHLGFLYCVRFDPEAKLLVTGGLDGILRVTDVPTGKPRYEVKADAAIMECAVDPHGMWIATADRAAGVAKLWEARDRQAPRRSSARASSSERRVLP